MPRPVSLVRRLPRHCRCLLSLCLRPMLLGKFTPWLPWLKLSTCGLELPFCPGQPKYAASPKPLPAQIYRKNSSSSSAFHLLAYQRYLPCSRSNLPLYALPPPCCPQLQTKLPLCLQSSQSQGLASGQLLQMAGAERTKVSLGNG